MSDKAQKKVREKRPDRSSLTLRRPRQRLREGISHNQGSRGSRLIGDQFDDGRNDSRRRTN